MKITQQSIAGVFKLELEPVHDERGFFARAFCPKELEAAGTGFVTAQINLSRNLVRHTLRGMHFQEPPHHERKIVRCVRGKIFDVVADIEPTSPTYRRWAAFELDAGKGDALLIPETCAHGFLTLEADCDVLYQMDRAHTPGAARGFRYDDPAFAILWPAPPECIGQADLGWSPWPA